MSILGKRPITFEAFGEVKKKSKTSDVSDFEKYVAGIVEGIKTGEVHLPQEEKPKSKKYSDFSIETILGTTPEKKIQEYPCKNSTYGGHLHFMVILSEIRGKKTKRGDSLAKMTECLVCGSCSFSQSRAVASNYMAQHLFTHVQSPIFSCGICMSYSSSWKPRVQNHLKNGHPFLNHKNTNSCIVDHRFELDPLLSALALQCYDY